MANFPLRPYQHAEVEVMKVIREAVIRSSSLIGSIASRPTRHKSRSVSVIQPQLVEHPMVAVSAEFQVPFGVIRSGDVETYVEILTEGFYEGFAKPLERNFIDVIGEITTATGNTIDAAEEGLGPFDAILLALESMEMSLDEDDNLVIPAIAANRETLTQHFSDPHTKQQQARLNELLARKREDLISRRKSRRLEERWETS